MKLRLPGLGFFVELNGYMFAGTIVFLLGAGGYVAGEFGAYPPDTVLTTVFFGLTVAGLSLYFVGRLVQFVAYLRRRNP